MKSLALCGVLMGALACGGAAHPERPPNVILICLDTVRADHLGCYGYDLRSVTPAMDELAERSTVFLDTSATAGWTKPSVPSFLTGTYPLEHGVYRGSSRDENGVTSDVLPADALTLAEVFSEQGYATAAFVKNAQLRKGQGFEQGFDLYKDEAGDARQIRWWATDWLEARDPDRPFFLYLHFLDAHWPYAVPDEYAALFAGEEEVERFRGQDWRALRDDINHGRRSLTSEEHASLLALYDGSIRYIDDELGRLFGVLERLDLAQETVVSVMADHGEEFLEHGRIGHGHGLYENLLSVPWILHIPGRAAERQAAPCSLVDLFPTLLSAAGLDAGREMEGVDRLTQPDLSRPIFAEHLEPGSYRRSWRRDAAKLECKLIIDESGAAVSVEEHLAAVRPGSRWEARVEGEPGGLRVVRLRARAQDPSGPTEIKGPVEDVDGDVLRVNGVSIHRAPAAELYGDGAGEEIVVGSMAKARGTFDAEGRFMAGRIKVYGPDQEPEREIRGVVGRVEDGRMELGGLWLDLDPEVQLERDASRKRFDRELVVAWLGMDPEAKAGILSEYGLRDLDLDPEELEAALKSSEGSEELRAFCRQLLARRVWSHADSASLSADDLEHLRAIGYAE